MERKRDGLVPIREAFGGLDGGGLIPIGDALSGMGGPMKSLRSLRPGRLEEPS